MLQLTFVCFLLLPLSVVGLLPINDVIGEPAVECGEREIRVSVRTSKPFHGRMFIRGNSQRAECAKDFTQTRLSSHENATQVQMTLDYNACGTERIRSLSPKGVTYASTVVLQFHKIFITHGDKSFHIRCFYAELDATVTSQFEVGHIPTTSIEMTMDPPKCSYTVRSNSFNGPVVRSAKVGDEVFHRWECTGNNGNFQFRPFYFQTINSTHFHIRADIYGMLVHSCFVEDQQGRNTEIVDRDGCSTDRELLPELLYNNDLGLAYARTEVFKYPDYSFVHFKCQIKICNKLNDGCRGLSPPSCDARRESRFKRRSIHPGPQQISIDVITPDILVIDSEDVDFNTNSHPLTTTPQVATSLEGSWLKSEIFSSQQPSTTCNSEYIMFCVMISILSILVASTFFILYLYMRKSCAERSISEENLHNYFSANSIDQLTKRIG
ncbi:Cuticlin-1 [Trichinella nelsoni]|uniref:Cuticlin-1 n=2 Tax=Trichinella TaxID=6333 RepID=A0A0V1KWS8_9BILA|nr:Cuticlin-1 [Trichinella nelsoni]KRZ51771.1 Cuticlin-1 [Trichinella nativa]